MYSHSSFYQYLYVFMFKYYFYGSAVPSGSGPHHCRGFTVTRGFTTVGRTPLDEWSARRRYLYLTTHNRQTSMPPAGFEPAIPASERPQTHATDRAATATGTFSNRRAARNSVLRYTAGISLYVLLPSELPDPKFLIDAMLTQFSNSNYIALHTVPSPHSCFTFQAETFLGYDAVVIVKLLHFEGIRYLNIQDLRNSRKICIFYMIRNINFMPNKDQYFNFHRPQATAHCLLSTALRPLPTVHRPPSSVHCPLPTAHCPLSTVHRPLPTTHRPLPTLYSLLATAHCLLPTAHCPLHIAYCPPPTAHRPLPTVHCPLSTGHCPLTCLCW